jgi:hypothetical protein
MKKLAMRSLSVETPVYLRSGAIDALFPDAIFLAQRL